jgi:hypothetical protein
MRLDNQSRVKQSSMLHKVGAKLPLTNRLWPDSAVETVGKDPGIRVSEKPEFVADGRRRFQAEPIAKVRGNQ